MKTYDSFVQTQWEAQEESMAEQRRKQTGSNVDGPCSLFKRSVQSLKTSEQPKPSDRTANIKILITQKLFSVTNNLMRMCLDHAMRAKFSKQEKETKCLQTLFNDDWCTALKLLKI